MSAFGSFSENTTPVTGYVNEDLTKYLYFYSLPACKNGGIPGKVLVTVLMNDNTLKTKEFPFSNAPVIENGKTSIHLTLRPGSNESKLNFTGSIKIESSWKKEINLDIKE